MHNRIKNVMELTKSISSNGIIYVENGISFTVGVPQFLQAVSDVTLDPKSIKLGMNDHTFKIDSLSFIEFLKDYKKSITDTTFDGNTFIIHTSIPDVEYKSEWNSSDDMMLSSYKKTINDLIKGTESYKELVSCDLEADFLDKWKGSSNAKLYFDLNDAKVDVDKSGMERYLTLSLLPKYKGKWLKTSKDANMTIYQSKNNENLFILKLSINNGKCNTTYYGKFMSYIKELK